MKKDILESLNEKRTSPVVKCTGHTRGESRRFVLRISDLFTEHLEPIGFDSSHGEWTFKLFKKTGAGLQEKIVFKRVVIEESSGRACLEYLVRPYDRDSTWIIRLFPPPGADANDIPRRLGITTAESEKAMGDEMAKVAEQVGITVNQARLVRVSRHLDHGVEVEVEEGLPGFIPLSDLCFGAKYDKKEMNKYPVGRKLKVVVADVEKFPIRCSIHTDGIIETDHPTDVFTGRADADGRLKWAGFLRDHNRVYELVSWMGLASIDLDPERKNLQAIPYDQAVGLVDEFMLTRYGSKAVKPFLLLDKICRGAGVCSEPMLYKNDDNSISLTQFAIDELGGVEGITTGIPKEPALKIEAEQLGEPEGIEPAPEPEPKPESEPNAEPTHRCPQCGVEVPDERRDLLGVDTCAECKETEDLEALGVKEPLSDDDLPEGDLLEEPEEEPEEPEPKVELRDLVAYISKAVRRDSIAAQIESLRKEYDEIEAWLREHNDAFESMKEEWGRSLPK